MAKIRQARILGEDLYAEEGDKIAISFINELRGYNVAMGAFNAIDQDICHEGASFKPVLNKLTKRLRRFKENVESSEMPDEQKKSLLSKADSFLADADQIVQSLTGSCRKTAGECTIGASCFPANVLKAMDEIIKLKEAEAI